MAKKSTEKEKAFPLAEGGMIFNHGMTLRDYFAAHALVVANKIGYQEIDTDRPDDAMKRVVDKAYEIADEMIRKRELKDEH